MPTVDPRRRAPGSPPPGPDHRQIDRGWGAERETRAGYESPNGYGTRWAPGRRPSPEDHTIPLPGDDRDRFADRRWAPGYGYATGYGTPEHRAAAGRRGAAGRPRRRRRGRWVLAVVAVFLIGLGSAGALAYARLNGNITADPLFAGTSGNAGTEAKDVFGHSPINILVIGSDQRATAQDCRLGGDCHGGSDNADVEMVVHVSADRSNATVMSVPRDTVTQLPACRDARHGRTMSAQRGQINATLAYGPGCTVAAVHQLTGIPLDHFVMVDFSGVVAMSDAVGGVNVCVSADVYDSYSHLRLTRGTHTLQGVAALEFVRSRHAFGDGSDLGRTDSQHLFLSALVRKLKSAGSLADPATLYSLAGAATRSLTVDTGLANIPALVGLASDLNAVPARRIVFTTMPTVPDPANTARVVPAASSGSLFETIAADHALTTGTPSATLPTTMASPTPPSPPSAGIAVRVRNAGGRTGRAAELTHRLAAAGFVRTVTDRTHVDPATSTVLQFGAGEQAAAERVADTLGLPASALRQVAGTGVVVVIGSDWPTGDTYPGRGSTGAAASSSVTASGLVAAQARTADQAGTCAPVSRDRTVVVNHLAMTPSQAFAATPTIPVSAP